MSRYIKAWPVWLGAAAVAAALVFAFTTAGGPTATTIAASEIAVEGLPLPQLVDPTADSAVGQPSPVVSGTGLDGEPITIGQGGRPSVVLFVAHWCSHCQAEVPRVQAYVDEGGTSGVDIATVATSNAPDRPNYPAADWLVRENWTSPVLLDDDSGSVAQAFGLSAFPFFVVLDASGEVVLRVSGELNRTALQTLFEIARTS